MIGAIFVGLQASGKYSFFLKQLYHTYLRMNMGMLKTRNRERILFEACLDAKQPVVLDNTNPTREDRIKYIEKLKASRFEVIGYYFRSSLEECLARNNERKGKGKEKIPDIALKGTFNKLELPEYSENFDKLFYVNIKDGEFYIEDLKNEV